MATSSSKDFSLTVGELLKAARRQIPGRFRGDPKEEDNTNREALNMLLKHWQGEGIGLWMIREIDILLSDGGYEYDLGPSGKFTYSLTKTELGADAASGASSLTVDSITGISDADYLGVELDDGTLQWTTVSGSPSGTTVTPAATLTSAASEDNHVYAFTSLADRPLSLWNVRLVDPSENETVMTEIAVVEYDKITDKDSEGPPNQWAYDKQLTNGVLKIWPAADDVQYRLKARAKIEIDDIDSTTEDAELPKQYYRALKYNLANDLYNEYDPEKNYPAELWEYTRNDIRRKAEMYKIQIAEYDSEEASVIFDYVS